MESPAVALASSRKRRYTTLHVLIFPGLRPPRPPGGTAPSGAGAGGACVPGGRRGGPRPALIPAAGAVWVEGIRHAQRVRLLRRSPLPLHAHPPVGRITEPRPRHRVDLPQPQHGRRTPARPHPAPHPRLLRRVGLRVFRHAQSLRVARHRPRRDEGGRGSGGARQRSLDRALDRSLRPDHARLGRARRSPGPRPAGAGRAQSKKDLLPRTQRERPAQTSALRRPESRSPALRLPATSSILLPKSGRRRR